MSQEIIFTTIPNQKKEIAGNQVLQLSVFVSLRLKSAKDSTLASFDDILNWTEKIINSQYQFRLQNGKLVDGELQKQKINNELFKNLFHNDIRVKGFLQEDLSLKRINSFPQMHVKDFILKNYVQTAIDSPKEKITADKFVDEESFGIISKYQLNEKEIEKIDDPQHKTPLLAKNLVLKKVEDENEHKRVLKERSFVPFSKKINPKSDFTQFRNFHKVDKKIKVKESIKIKKPEFEFHDIIAIVNNYPQLMRKFGFILDFIIPLTNEISKKGTIHVVPIALNLSDTSTDISTPPVAYEITDDGFYIADKAGSIFKRGYVRINTDEFSVNQVDADGVALKTSNMTDTKVTEIANFFEKKSKLTIENNQRIVKSKTIKKIGVQGPRFQTQRTADKITFVEPPEDEGLPFMRSAGIAITRNGMAEHIFTRFNNSITLQDNILKKAPVNKDLRIRIPSNILYSDDLIQGYRMDIAYEEEPDKWYSLHIRKDEYTWYDESNNPNPISDIDIDEGYIELAVAEDDDDPDDIFVSETLARWEGWSLSVRKPGYAINESDDYQLKSGELQKRDFVYKNKIDENKKYAFDPDLQFKVNAQSNIIPGTLPKLRFGKKYRVRVRAVDLAGNSVSLNHPSEDVAETVRKNIKYLRYEPLASPIVLVGNQLKDGEFLERMVIRSNYDATTEEYENKFPVNHQIFDEFSQRFLLPPKNSQLMAETHGMFEKAFENNPNTAKEIYEIITSHEGLYEYDKQKEKIYQPSEVEIIYLPDPMAAGVALFIAEGYEHTHTQEFKPRMFSFFNKQEISPDKTNIDIPEDWYKAAFIRLRLEEGEINTKWSSSDKTLTIFLPKGYRTRIKFSTFWREKDFKELSALWGLIKEKSPSNISELEKIARAGQHWMLSPSREMELVHAVQQPVDEPIIKVLIPERSEGDTIAKIHTKFTIHGESTEKVEFQAKWSEFNDDGISLTIKRIEGRNAIPDIKVNYPDDVITKGTVPSFNNIQIKENPKIFFQPQKKLNTRTKDEFKLDPQPESLKVNNLFKTQNVAFEKMLSEKSKATKNLKNRLKFEIQESKFSFLKEVGIRINPLIQNFGDTKHRWVDYKIVGTSRYREYFDKILKEYQDQNTLRESKWIEKVNILSTARPKVPEIDYIIPTFEWLRGQDVDTISHQRMGGGLRVFLKRPWYSTGDDEMLGVILPPAPQKNLPSISMVSQSYSSIYTHWGIDPLHNSTQPSSLSPAVKDFRLNPLIDEKVEYADLEDVYATVVAYPVKFDEERQQWFCDIAINPQNMYFPFIKLALARYQPHSIRTENTDLCLSPVVMADMMQLMPDRISTIQFKREDENSRFTVTVTGVIYSDISNRQLIYNYIKISILDSEIGQPIYGVIDDGIHKRKVEKEITLIEIEERDVLNNRFRVSTDIRLPSKYKTAPFEIIIEEFERGPKRSNISGSVYSKRIEQSEETDKPVYIDVFKINEVKS